VFQPFDFELRIDRHLQEPKQRVENGKARDLIFLMDRQKVIICRSGQMPILHKR
jgi:hypothetical protein